MPHICAIWHQILILWPIRSLSACLLHFIKSRRNQGNKALRGNRFFCHENRIKCSVMLNVIQLLKESENLRYVS